MAYLLLALPLVAQATNLATVNPCPDCPTEVSHAPITVTKQFQVVSTCSASTTRVSSTLYRYYPCEPSTWVSTVIPTISNGQFGNVTVTQTDQKVTFSAFSSVETITNVKTVLPTIRRRYEPPRFGFRAVNVSSGGAALPIGGTSTGGAALPGVITSPTVVTETAYRTHEIYDCAPFNQMGPIALPGNFPGSGICTGVGPDERGALTQTVEITSCVDHACTVTSQTWIQEPVPTVTHGTTTTITITRTVGIAAAPTGTGCTAFRLKAVRDNTKYHHGAQGYLSFPGSEGVLVGKKEAASFSIDQGGVLSIDGKHVCASGSGPVAKTQRTCRGAWTLEEDGTVSYAARNNIAFCFAKDKTVFSRNSNRSGCKPVKFVAECIAPKQALPQAPAAVQPLPQQTAPPSYGGGAAAPAPGNNPPSYGGGGAAAPAPGGNSPPTYGGGAAPAPGSGNPPSYGGGAAPAPGGGNPPSYGGGAAAPGGNNPPSYGGGAAAPGGNNPPSYGGGAPAPGGNNPPYYGGGGVVPAPGQSTTCTESLIGQPTQQPPSYGGSIPVYGTGAPLPQPTTTTTCTTSFSLTDLPTGPTGTTSKTNTATDMPTGPTRTTSRSTSLTDKPTGPTRTTTTTDMSADPSAADPTAMPSPLRFEAMGARLMARGDEDPLDEGDVGQLARRHRRSRSAGRANRWA